MQDQDGDVRAVAAGALLPLAPALLAAEHPQQLAQLQSQLWEILVVSDELSPATGWRCERALTCISKHWHAKCESCNWCTHNALQIDSKPA
jgi:hypothetical protein